MNIAAQALDMLGEKCVDAEGFDYMDRKLLLAVIDKFFGGPVGLDNLAAAIGEERETIEDVLEPYLIQQGFFAAGYYAWAYGDDAGVESLWHNAARNAVARCGWSARAAAPVTGNMPDATLFASLPGLPEIPNRRSG
ncbi:hypothetical protein MJK71_18255 [Escherichia coli]|nr:hypothetical protein MJK71_18255 [Escherichia coli]